MYRNFRIYRAPAGDEGEGGEGTRPDPAVINDQQNRRRLSRIEQIARGNDGRRSSELSDVDGENATGRFQGGELDDSPEARERAAELADEQAAEALREQEARASEADEEARGAARAIEEARARGLQEEGGEDDGEGRETQRAEHSEAGDEKVVDGVRYYLTIVGGQEKWLTLKQLRDGAAISGDAEETLQRAQDALKRSTQAALSPKDEPVELGEAELENVVLSAVMGDSEAVKRLVSVIRSRPTGASPQDVSRQVSQQIATSSAIRSAEEAQTDLLSSDVLGPIFRTRLRAFAAEKPDTRIPDAYAAVGAQMRKDFAPMLGKSAAPLTKEERKRTIVSPPQGAGRQQGRSTDDSEVPVSTVIDQMAKGRGQDRAIRSGRR